jgi:hypothetical protein
MTITDYLKQMEQLERTGLKPCNPEQGSIVKTIQDVTDIWNNNACIGYCISAALSVGLDKQQTSKLINALGAAFEEMTVDEAEQFYQNGEY